MRYYWMSNFVTNITIYCITMLLFNLVGAFVVNLSFFTNTSYAILILMYLGWGLCQIGMAFFFQAFLNNARSATSNNTIFILTI